MAFLYMPVTLHHAFLEGNRVSQLAYRGAQQLQRKLGFPVGDHSELKTVDLDILKDWETVIDRRTRRTSHERREDSVWRGLWSGVG